MNDTIILTYAGKVELIKGGLGAKYFDLSKKEGEQDSIYIFKKRLLGFETVGRQIECERTATGVKSPYRPILGKSKAPEKLVLEWSVDELIEQLQKAQGRYFGNKNRAFALYVYTKLLE